MISHTAHQNSDVTIMDVQLVHEQEIVKDILFIGYLIDYSVSDRVIVELDGIFYVGFIDVEQVDDESCEHVLSTGIGEDLR